MKELEKLLHSDVSEDRHYRNELKYVCSEGELQLILARIRHICPSDSHASATGTYSIRSIYFDDAQNRCFLENENGTDPREKFRIRIYNASDRRITLECKRKEHTMTNKVSCSLTKDQLTMILNGSLPESAVDSDLLRKLFLLHEQDNLKPNVIVAYERTPFVYAPGNVRITFDRNIGSTMNISGFFDPYLPLRPVLPTGKHILEVKYDAFLPDFLYEVMNLGSLTQTAFLQLNGDLADPAEVERQLDVFETSSPSYPLMVSLDGCTRWLADEGEAAFAAWSTRLDAFDAAVRDLKNTKILCCGADALTAHPDFFTHDSGKILLQIGAAGAAYLRADGFEPEMVCGPNVLAMTSPCDDADALERLADVLHAWDKTAAPPAAPRHILPAPGAARCTIAEALLRPARAVRMRDAVGEIAAEYLWAYPPGVPLVAPGEEVTAELVTACRALEQAGTALKHTGGSGAEEIAVLL